MNYFELFDIPVKLKVDSSGLHPKYIALSRQYHPDYFVGKGDAQLSESIEVSATLNKAYKTLQEPDATIKYVLQLKGMLEEDEKYQLPRDFLMKVMELNEQLMDLEMTGVSDGQRSLKNLQLALHNLQTAIYEPVKKIIENYQENITSTQELLQVKDYYYKKKYLDRMGRELAGKL